MKITIGNLRRLIREAVFAFQDPDLEAYRLQVIKDVKVAAESLQLMVAKELGLQQEDVGVYLMGSVIEPKRFKDTSDVDVGFSIPGNSGLDEEASEKVQEAAQHEPIGEIGVVNTLVFRGPVDPKIGTTKHLVGANRDLPMIQ